MSFLPRRHGVARKRELPRQRQRQQTNHLFRLDDGCEAAHELQQRPQLLQLAVEVQVEAAHVGRVTHVLDGPSGDAHQRRQKLLLIRLDWVRRRPDADLRTRADRQNQLDARGAQRLLIVRRARLHRRQPARMRDRPIARHEPAPRQHMRHRRTQQMLQQLIDIVRALKHARRLDQGLEARALECQHSRPFAVGSRQEMSQKPVAGWRLLPTAYCQLPTLSAAASSPCAARSSCPARCRSAPRPSAS